MSRRNAKKSQSVESMNVETTQSPVTLSDDNVTQPPVETTQPPVNVTQGRALRDTLTPEQLRGQIDALLNALRVTTSQSHKKRLRRALRARGHYGGLSHERVTSSIDDLTRVNAS